MPSVSPTSASCPGEHHSGHGAYLKFEITSISDSDATTNKRYVSWKITFQGTPWVQLFKAYATLGNTTIYDGEPGTTNWSVGTILTSNTTTFDNDSAGNLSLSFYMKQLFYYGTWSWDRSGYAQEARETFVFSQLPRYATFTNHTATSEINKITVTYAADSAYKAQKYTIDDGTTWTDCTAGSYDLSSLTPDTSYTIKTKIQRTDSDLWTESDAITIKTKVLPTSVAPADINFNGSIGTTFTPSISSIEYISSWYVIVKDGDTQVRSFSGSPSTVISEAWTLTASDFTNMLPRHTTTDNWNLTCVYKVISNGATYTLTDKIFKCTIPAGQYIPSYSESNLSYAVIDNLTKSLNNNATNKIIKSISTVRVTSTAASPQGSATISSYIASSGSVQNSASSTIAPINIDLVEANGNSVSVQVVDSRGRSNIVTKNFDAAIDYVVPRITSASVVRLDGIGTNLVVNIAGTYTDWSGLATSNTVEQVLIEYKEKTAQSYITISGITLTRTVGSGNFTFSGNITGNLFNATKEYDLRITLKDKIDNFVLQASILVGDALLWRDLANKRIGINKKPSYTLDVNGTINGSTVRASILDAPLAVDKLVSSSYTSVNNINMYDRTYINNARANRSMFLPYDSIQIEYSSDNGSSWTTATTSQVSIANRAEVFAGNMNGTIPLSLTAPITNTMICRITINNPGTTESSTWECIVDRFFMYLQNSASHELRLTIEYSNISAISNYHTIILNQEITTEQQLIALNSELNTWGTNSSNVAKFRFTFTITDVGSSTSDVPIIRDIRLYGKKYLGTNQVPRHTDYIYSWDYNKNVSFPANINGQSLSINGTDILSKIYPIGSIYMSVNNTDPGTLFGGTWVQLKDRFLLGAGDTYINGDIDGEAEHTLTVDEMPSHNHSARIYSNASGDWHSYALNYNSNNCRGWTDSYLITSSGGNQSHNNMPPYLVVYMWKRTA